MIHTGSCHCGRIAFEVEGNVPQVMERNCSHCSRNGYLLWFGPKQQLKFDSSEANLGTYMFNKHVIKHRFCGVWGRAPFDFGKDPKGQETAAVNV